MHTKAEITICSYLILYGSLMSAFSTQQDLGLQNRITLVGPCKLHGKLYDLGEYPGLIFDREEKHLVSAELYQISDQETS